MRVFQIREHHAKIVELGRYDFIFFCKIHSSAMHHDKDKCLTPETGLIQICFKLEHHTALSMGDVWSRGDAPKNYPRKILQWNCPTFAVEAVVWQKNLSIISIIIKAKRSPAFEKANTCITTNLNPFYTGVSATWSILS